MTQNLIFITSGSSWLPPSDCFQLDWVDCIGAGGGGYTASGGNAWDGGGGAWSRGCVDMKVKPVALSLNVGAGVAGPNAGGDTWFNASSLSDAQSKGASLSCAAKGGSSANNNATALGGQSASGVGLQKYSGGNGSAHPNPGFGRGAGGAAAGPTGNGANAASAPSGTLDAAPGVAVGHEYDATHGSGSGSSHGDGGLYGGGAGCPASTASVKGGDGLIVIAYTPFKGAPGGFNMPMMGI